MNAWKWTDQYDDPHQNLHGSQGVYTLHNMSQEACAWTDFNTKKIKTEFISHAVQATTS